eukprot:5806234-Prymnesium_polylepis.1
MLSTVLVPSYRGYRPQTTGRSLELNMAPITASVVGIVIYETLLSPRGSRNCEYPKGPFKQKFVLPRELAEKCFFPEN